MYLLEIKQMAKLTRVPCILVNFKAYAEAFGNNGLKLARIAEEVSLNTGVCIGVSPYLVDIHRIADEVDIPVYAQHVDSISYGCYTGSVLPEAVKEAGACGTILSHCERKLNLVEIERSIERTREVGLFSIVCSATPEQTSSIIKFDPDMVAIEPPELIGTGVSVSKTQPEAVTNVVKLIRETNSRISVFCGAGITSKEDVAIAMELGVDGVLIASGVVKSKDWNRCLYSLANATREKI
jgi:triosephosphate isomerase